jgi:hypothetical protein
MSSAAAWRAKISETTQSEIRKVHFMRRFSTRRTCEKTDPGLVLVLHRKAVQDAD